MPYPTEYALKPYLAPSLRVIVTVCSAIVFVLVVAPCLYLIIWSIYGTDTVGMLRPFDQPTVEWFKRFFAAPSWRYSLIYSAAVATTVTAAGTAALLMYSYAIRFSSWIVDSASLASCILILLTPPIAYALALRFVTGTIDTPEWLALWVGHLVLVLPLQFLVFESAREGCSDQMLLASHTLGANHWQTLVLVYLPNVLRPALFAAVVGFFVSFDEVVIAIFVIDSSDVTIPKRLWNEASQLATPEPAVIAVMLLFAFAVLLVVAETVRRVFSQLQRNRR